MASEVSRKEYGETPNGYVVVITKQSPDPADPNGLKMLDSFDVRQGAHTVMSTDKGTAAEACAKALVAGA